MPPTRRLHVRQFTRWDVTWQKDGQSHEGVALEASKGGVFIEAPPEDTHGLTTDDVIELTLPSEHFPTPALTGKIRWVGQSDVHGCHGMGVEFEVVQDQLELFQRPTATDFRWHIEDSEGVVTVMMSGAIDEHFNADELLANLPEQGVIFDMSGVYRVNSFGVREWISFIRNIPGKFAFARCSPEIVAQINMIPNFVGSGSVSSVFAPYICSSCHHQAALLMDVEGCQDIPPIEELPCSVCSKPMEFDDVEDSYFAFLM